MVRDAIICVRANVRSLSSDGSSVLVQLGRGSPCKPEQIVLLLGGVDDVLWVRAGPSADPACTNKEDVPTTGLCNFVVERSKWNVKQTEDGVTGRHLVKSP